MAYHTTDSFGVTEMNPPPPKMAEILASLDDSDEAEHVDVALIHDSGWALTAYPTGILCWENFEDEDEPPLFMRKVSRERMLELWEQLAKGRIRAVAQEPWEEEES